MRNILINIILIISICTLPIATYAVHTISPFADLYFCNPTYPTASKTVSFSLNEVVGDEFTLSQTNRTIILTLPANFEFTAAGTVTRGGAPRDINNPTFTWTATTITVTITTDGTPTNVDHINFNNFQIRAIGPGSGDLIRTGGTFQVEGTVDLPGDGTPNPVESFGYMETSVGMTYNSSTVSQASTADINRNCTSKPYSILEIAITVTGNSGCPAKISQFVFNTTGDVGYSQNPALNIANASVYYSGQTQNGAYTDYFGTVGSPNGVFTINGYRELNQGAGTYYFYLTYDVPITANIGESIDASMSSFIIDGITVSDMTNPNPFGFRTIIATQCYTPDLPGPPSNIQTATIGSLVIPMDNAHQNLWNGYPFNIKAYGLVHELLLNDIPVKWIIRSGKTKDNIDFSGNVERIYPTFIASSLQDFRAGAFIIDSNFVNNSYNSWGKTADEVISVFANKWKVAVYRLTSDVNVDVRYTLNQRPKIAVFNNGGNQILQTKILDSAKVTNYVAIDAGVFTGLAECYTFCSEAHWAMNDADTVITQKVWDFVFSGGNFLAQCHAVEAGDDLEGYERNERFQTTIGLQEIGITTSSNSYYNTDLAFMQFEGLMKADQNGSGKNFRLKAGGSWKNGFYHAVSTENSLDTVVATGSKLMLLADSAGGNVFYLGGHDYFAGGAADWSNIQQINAGRLYLNASLIPAARPTTFTVDLGTNQTICVGDSVILGGSPTGPIGTIYNWTPSTGLDNPNSPNPVASPDTTTTYTLVADNGGCPGGGAIVVTVNPAPVAIPGTDQTFCSNNGAVTLNGAVNYATGGTWSTSGTGTFNPSPDSLNCIYYPSDADTAAGSVLLTLTTTGICNPTSNSITVTFSDSPIAVPGPDVLVCATSFTADLDGSVIRATGGYWTSAGTGTFVPDSATLNATYIPSQADIDAGSVLMTLTTTGNGTCNPASASNNIIFTADSISVDAGPDTLMCSPGIILDGQVSVATGGVWSTLGTGTFSPSDSLLNAQYFFSSADTAAGSVQLVLTTTGNGACASKSDTMKVTFREWITVTASYADTVCANRVPISISASSSTGQGVWSSDGGGIFSPDNTSANITYTTTLQEDSAGMTTLYWSSTNNDGCASAIDTINIVIAPQPTVDAGPDAIICIGTTYTNIGAMGGSTTSVTWGTTGTGTFDDVNSLTPVYTPSSADYANDSVYLYITSNDPPGLCVADVDTMVLSFNDAVLINPATGAIDLDNAVLMFDGFGFEIVAGPADSYLWNTGETTQSIVAQDSGWYWVNMTINTNFCSIIDSIYISYNQQITLGNDTSICYADSLILNIGAGYSWYTWSNGVSSAIDSTITVSGGTYSVTVTDQYGTTSTTSIKITEGEELIASIIGTDVKCNGGSDGVANLTVTGGFAPYSYLWSNASSTEDISGLLPGVYSVTVTDNISCQTSSTVTIGEPAPLTATITVTDVTCFENTDGTADLTVSGGTSPYSYNWDYGQTTEDISNLAAGTYLVTVTGANLCTTTASATVTRPAAALSAYIIGNNVACKGGNTGSTNVTVSGGTSPYAYLWSNGETTNNIDSLLAGVYTLTVIDAQSCTTIASVTITEPSQNVSSVATATNVSCNGGINGAIDITVSGGTPEYTFSWNIGQITEDISGVGVGVYTVTITDANFCSTTNSVTITEPSSINITSTITDTKCYGSSDGSIYLSLSGGTSPYSFIWSNSSTNEDISVLPSGSYTVTVTDSNLCKSINSYTVNQPNALTVGIYGTNVKCKGGSTGEVNITVNGGTQPYTYLWSNGSTTEDITGLATGIYSVVVKDSNLCSVNSSMTITEPASSLSASIATTNMTCYNVGNGSLNLTVTGGTSGYTYLWSNGLTNEDISQLQTGTYVVTVTDINLCTTTTSATITAPSEIIITSSQTNSSCGSNTGSASIVVSGGISPYTYLWSNSSTATSLTNLSAGAYTVSVTDANSCIESKTLNITDINAPTITLTSSTDVTCAGSSDGSAAISASGGATPYIYQWSSGGSSASVSGLAGGTYIVSVIDNNGCQGNLSVVINEPAQIGKILIAKNVSCYGGADGAINLIVSGGSFPFSYLWSNNATTEDLNNISSGVYSVTITDANNCQATTSINVSQPGASVTPSLAITNVNCFGGSTGSINLSVLGGTAPFSYQWSSGQNSEDLNIIPAGAYTVTVTDANHCTATSSVTVNQPALLEVTSMTGTNVSCYGGSDGAIDLEVSGGTPNYSYSWNFPYSTQDLTGIIAGVWEVTVTDTKSCTATSSITITQPSSSISTTISKTNVKCNGGNSGTINLSVSGGTPPYTYLWSNGATTQDLSNIIAGNYSVTVTDSKNCTKVATTTITQPLVLAGTITSTNVSCYGGSDGEANLVVTGGTPLYSYQWNVGQITEDIANLPSGVYIVTITDAKLCKATSSVTITQPTAITTSYVKVNASCKNGNDGSIDLSVSGGNSPYTYLWNIGQSTQDINNLTGDVYEVTITDANSCSVNSSIIISEPTDAVSVFIVGTNQKCKNGTDGAAEATASGGTPPYTYLWSNGATTKDISGLSAGIYTITAYDASGCTGVSSVTITEPANLLVLSLAATNPVCYGDATGSINLIITGGVSPYSYQWSNSAMTEDINSIQAGTYYVTVTDANSCIKTSSATLTQPSSITISETKTNSSCGASDGAASISVTGGSAPYTYLWSNSSVSNSITNVPSGAYSVTVTDNNACTESKTININDIGGPVINISYSTDVLCNGAANGQAVVFVQSGLSPYSYLWSAGSTTNIQNILTGGTYSVTVTDDSGCISTASVVIDEPDALVMSAYVPNVCDASSTGFIDLSVSGGVMNYSYLWSNGATTQDLINIPAGNYVVTVTDVNSCTIVSSFDLNIPAQTLTPSYIATNVKCKNGTDGAISISTVGGTPGYSYFWNTGQSTQNISGIVAGVYEVTVTDAISCISTLSVTVTEPLPLDVSVSATNVVCNSGNTGAIDINVIGGTPGYTYLWSNAQTTEDISGLTANTYSVTITDSNSCKLTTSTIISEPTAISSSISETNVKCFGGSGGAANLTVSGGSPVYTYLWSNGATSEDLNNITSGNYIVTITDSKACQSTASVSISQPSQLTAGIVNANVNCYGGSSGNINVTTSGGTPSYTYLWNYGQTTEDLNNIQAGSYQVTVTDANLCTTTSAVTVSQPASALSPSVSKTDVTCFGSNTGAINLTVSGGTPNYSYSWSNGLLTEDVSSLIAGTYTVTVSDVNGCTSTVTTTINQPAAISATSAITNVKCNGGATGSINITVSGGMPVYSYLWSNGNTNEDITLISAGSYNVTITDANSCTGVSSFSVTQPQALSATISGVNLNCYGQYNGQIDLTVSGGTPIYTYTWNQGSTTQDLTNLNGGYYEVTISDVNLCTAVKGITITEPTLLSASAITNNIKCYGQNTGSINLIVSGGTPNYTYSWSNSSISEDLNNLTAGNYSATITDSKSCQTSYSTTITQPAAALSSSTAKTNVSCFNGSDGAIDLSVSGGIVLYSYLWSNGESTQDISNITSGNYSVTVTDANNCTSNTTVTISQPDSLYTTHNSVDVSCFGGSSGSVNINVIGGTPAYSYLWSSGQVVEDLINIQAGTYILTITDSKLCKAYDTIIVNQPLAALSTLYTTQNVSCYSGNDAIIDLEVAGGTSPYTYYWNLGQTTQDLTSNVSAGTYSVTVTDVKGCKTTQTVIITEPDALLASISITPVKCFGNSDGIVNLTVSGGTSPYTYLWSNSITSEDLSNISAGVYIVTITDNHACQNISSTTVTQPNILSTTNAVTNVKCKGDSTGSVNLTVSGGSPVYTYLWNYGQVTEDVTLLPAGTYSVTVTDSKNCKTSSDINITEPSLALSTQISKTDVKCFGGNSGSTNLTVSGGTSPYTYLWNYGQTTQNLTNVSANNYCVVVTDANSCTETACVTITQPSAISASSVETKVKCKGDATGGLDITTSGGVPPYTFVWNNGLTTEDIAGVAAGVYIVTITDSYFCNLVKSFTVTEPAAPLTATAIYTNVSCYNGSNGNINVTVTGGTPAYTYLWNIGQTSEDVSNLSQGTYEVTVTDANLCTTSKSYTLTQPSELMLSTTQTNSTCGVADGTASVTATGGTNPYTYLWSNGATSSAIVNISSGLYSVTVTDNNSCYKNVTIPVNDEGAPSCSIVSTTHVTCNGDANGAATVLAVGGTGAYTFGWSQGTSTATASGLSGGVYYVSVTDENHCLSTSSVTINEPAVLSGNITPVNVKCKGNSTGSANLTVSGGTPNYTYVWSTGANTEDISGLPSAQYSVSITDSHGCKAYSSVSVTEPAFPVTLSLNKTNVSCNGGSNGSIDLSVFGGTPGYTYIWNFGQTSQDITGIAAGLYEVTVTDNNLCKGTTSTFITEPLPIQVQASITNSTCNGQSNGAVNISVSGGTSPYSYSWSNGSFIEDIVNVSGGIYTVTITDSNNCNKIATYTVTEPTGHLYTLVPTAVKCYGDSTGSIALSVSGGTLPYTYLWSSGQTSEDISGLSAGTYTVTIQDSKLCTTTASSSVTQPSAPLSVSATQSNLVCYGGNNATVSASVTGGTSPYTYMWNYGQMTPSITGLTAGLYELTVTDKNGCKDFISADITEPNEMILSPGQVGSTCGVPNGTATISVIGGTSPYAYLWNTSETTNTITNLYAGAYSVEVTDSNSCKSSITINVSDAGSPSTSVAYDNVSCFGLSDAYINMSVSGGTTPYTYLWNNNATSEDLNNISGGTYTITITDANGCKTTTTTIIIEPPKISIIDTSRNVTCKGYSNGFINVTISGGTQPYSYNWSNSETTQDLTNIAGGYYTLTVTDLNSCSKVFNKTITEPALPLSNSFIINNVSCYNGTNGSINLIVTGGTISYSYKWNMGQTTEDLNNLNEGDYQVTITDANGCVLIADTNISQPTILIASVNSTNVNCRNGNDGFIDLTINGGVSPYSYFWENGQILEDINNLTSGTYNVTVTDSNQCKVYASASITQPANSLSFSAVKTNVKCYGDTTGIIDITVAGGTPAYLYNWSNGYTSQDISQLTAGVYSLTITDNNGCILSSGNISVTQPSSALISTYTNTDVLCYGKNNASINLTVNGGTDPYTYLWSSGQITQDLSGLYAGNYSVTISDINSCTNNQDITINQPTALNAFAVKTDVSCFGYSDGEVDLTVSGGTAPYLYSWNYGQVTEDLSLISSGSYVVNVNDAHNCNVVAYAIVTEPAILNAIINPVNVKCKGDSSGFANLIVSGGTVSYSYIWNTGAVTEDIDNINAGIYSVTITDSKNCVANTSTTISEPSTALSSSFINSNVSCNGQSDGSINLSVNGGTGTYTYQWNYGHTTQDLANLIAGNYEVTITDENSCVLIDSVKITQPQPIILTPGKTNSTCGMSNGSANVFVTGGTLPYYYAWSNGSQSQSITNISSGTYSVTVTDSKGCSKYIYINVNDQGAPISSISSYNNTSCYSYSDGSATVYAIGGTGTHSYLWTNGQTTETATALSVGVYSVSVTDQNHCLSSATVEINQPDPLELQFDPVYVSCNGGSNGSINLSVTGGTPNYSYLWNFGQTTQDIINLSAGTYEVTVTDSKLCKAIGNVNITQPNQVVNVTTSKTNVSCFGGNNGTISLTVTGGTSPYSYLWNNGLTNEDLIGLTSGSYEVTVTDNKGCTSIKTFNLTQPSAIQIGSVITNASCNNASNGAINITVNGGTSPYYYLWSNGSISQNISGLQEGIYTLTLSDNLGCENISDYTVIEPSYINAYIDAVPVSCYGESNGAATVVVTGGTAPYSYFWSNSETSEDIQNLTIGSYIVTVTDSKGCDTLLSVNITQPALPLTANITSVNVSCYGGSNGVIDLSVTGGTPGYTYKWNYGQTSQDINNLNANTYQVTVTDANGCDTSLSKVITQPQQIALTPVATYSACNAATGMATVLASGGVSPYLYYWSINSSLDTLFDIPSGAYSVSVTDMNGCVKTITVNVNDIGAPDLSLTHDNVSCNGMSDGWIDVTLSGSINAPISYEWSSGQLTEDISGLPGGQYFVIVTDSNGCKAFNNETIFEPEELRTIVFGTNVTCYHIFDGKINLTVTGGTGAGSYSYSWNNNVTSEDQSNIAAGWYFVTVTDANGCTKKDSILITQPADSLVATLVSSNVKCFDNSDAFINLTVSGGSPNYTYLWNFGQTTEDISNVQAGIYEVTITDAKGCTLIKKDTISQPDALSLTYTHNDVSCKGGNNGSIDLTVSGGTPNYSYLWNYGQTSEDLDSLSYGIYSVLIRDSMLCSTFANVTITEPIAPVLLQISGTDVLCKGGSDGTAFVISSGGTAPFTYEWNTGSSNSGISNLSSGNYSVTAIDNNGCEFENNIDINEPDSLIAILAKIDATCYGYHDASIDLTVSGGTQPYYYQWSPGNITQDISNITVGSYKVTITDANGCTLIVDTNITQPTELQMTNNDISNVSCYGFGDGSIDVTIEGGVPDYTYKWNYGNSTEDISNLSSGLYELTVTDMNGCTLIRNMSITEPKQITISPTIVNIDCNGNSNGQIILHVSGGTPNYVYQWSNGNNTNSLQNINAGSYSISITDANNCSFDSTIVITQPDSLLVSIAASMDADIGSCNGYLTLATNGGNPPYTYLWNNGFSGPTNNALCPFTPYVITITDANGCKDFISHYMGQKPPLPVADFKISDNGCAPHTVYFTNNSLYASSYLWDFGDGTSDTSANPSHEYIIASTYVVKLTSSNMYNDYSIDMNVVTIYEKPSIAFEIAPTTVTMYEEPIHCYNWTQGANTYMWHFGDGEVSNEFNPIHNYAEEGVYDIFLEAWSVNACYDSLTLKNAVIVETSCEMIFPDAFIPSQEGPLGGYWLNETFYSNRIFHPVQRKVTEYTLEIFTRWGQLLFVSDDLSVGWDGYFNGKLCQQDVYVYKSHWKCEDGTEHVKTGDITLYH